MLFTVILEFEGLNSVSQIDAADPDAAFRRWTEGLARPLGYGLDPKQAAALAKNIEGYKDRRKLTALEGMQNVWCTTELVGKTSALFNIIGTVPGEGGSEVHTVRKEG